MARILPAISLLTLAATAIAARRRAALPADRRFHVPYRAWIATVRGAFNTEQPTELALNVLLAASVLLAIGAVTYAVAATSEGKAFTEFYLPSENESGHLVADDYPTNFSVGTPRPLTVGVENHEHEPVEYTLIGLVQRVRVNGTNATVLESERIDRFEVRLPDNETWLSNRSVEPTLTGERLRLAYLLYRDAPPDEPTLANSYRSVHLWISVRE